MAGQDNNLPTRSSGGGERSQGGVGRGSSRSRLQEGQQGQQGQPGQRIQRDQGNTAHFCNPWESCAYQKSQLGFSSAAGQQLAPQGHLAPGDLARRAQPGGLPLVQGQNPRPFTGLVPSYGPPQATTFASVPRYRYGPGQQSHHALGTLPSTQARIRQAQLSSYAASPYAPIAREGQAPFGRNWPQPNNPYAPTSVPQRQPSVPQARGQQHVRSSTFRRYQQRILHSHRINQLHRDRGASLAAEATRRQSRGPYDGNVRRVQSQPAVHAEPRPSRGPPASGSRVTEGFLPFSSDRNTAAATAKPVQPGEHGTERIPAREPLFYRPTWEEIAVRMGNLPRGYFPRNKRPAPEEYDSDEQDCGPGGDE